jgi:uncharacterized protein (TIGR02145 family)
MKHIKIFLLMFLCLLEITALNAQSDFLISLPADSIKKITGTDTTDALAIIQNNSIVKIILPHNDWPDVVDADDNHYSVIKIGEQCWMAENLRTTKFNDGTNISLVEDVSKWSDMSSPAYCWYNNDQVQNKRDFGALYNWYTIESGKLCPLGWHIPTDEEWKQLEISIGMSNSLVDSVGYRGTNEAAKLKTYPDLWWDIDIQEATNESGFSAIPGGVRSGYDGRFYGVNKGTEWWTSTEYKFSAWMRGIINSSNEIRRYPDRKKDGRSVRCVKD